MSNRPSFRKRYETVGILCCPVPDPAQMSQPPPVSIELLGPPIIRVAGEPLEVDTRKAVALAAFLVASPHQPSRDELVGLLWSGLDQGRGRAALRRTLSALRTGLKGNRLNADRERIELDRTNLTYDGEEIQQLAESRHGHQAEQVCQRCAPELRRLLGLYRGSFLDGFYLRDAPEFEEWQRTLAEQHRRHWRDLVERLGLALAAGGRFGEAAEAAMLRVDADPLDEVAHRQVMQYLVWNGDRPGALKQYRDCAATLDRELGVAPLSETRELYELILEGIDPLPPADRVEKVGMRSAPARTSSPFVGRAEELSRLQASRGHLLVEGEEGIGKTRLLQRWLEETDGLVGLTRADPGSEQVPYLPIRDLLEQGAANRSGAAAPSLAAEAVRLYPGLTEFGFDRPAAAESGALAATHFHAGLAAALHHLYAGGVLVIDDCQWLDPSSVATLTVFLTRPPAEGARLVVAWRSEEVAPTDSFSRLLDRMVREENLERIALGPLSETEALDLLRSRSTVASEREEQIVNRAQGNPLFLVAYQDALGSEREDLPADLDRLLSQRFDRMSDAANQVLSTAGVLGPRSDLETIRQVSGRADLEMAEAVEELVALRLVDETEDGIAFAHEAVRRSIRERTSKARTRILHSRAADALTHRGPSAVLAHHLAEAGRSQDAASAYFEAGVVSLDLYAYESARELLQAAAALGYPDRNRLGLLLGICAVRTGDYGSALAAFATVDERATTSLEVGRVYMRLGRWPLAEAALARASELTSDSELLSHISADRAVVAHRQGDDEQARRWAKEAQHQGEAAGSSPALAQAANLAGMLTDDPVDALSHLRLAWELALQTARPDLMAATLNNLALAQRRAGDLEAAETCRDPGTTDSRPGWGSTPVGGPPQQSGRHPPSSR